MHLEQTNPNQLSVEHISLVGSLEIQLQAVDEYIKNKQEWIHEREEALKIQHLELLELNKAKEELETSIHILKHIQGRAL
jgi:hypothetical protein